MNGITERQAEVLAKLASGRRYRDAGAELFLSEFTIRRHVSEILERTTARTPAQAVAQAVASGRIVLCANGEFTPVQP